MNATPKYVTITAKQNIFIITAHSFSYAYSQRALREKGKS